MIDVVLTDEQVKCVESGSDVVRLVSPDGRVLAYVVADTEADRREVADVIASLKRPVKKWHTTAEVLDHLAGLTSR